MTDHEEQAHKLRQRLDELHAVVVHETERQGLKRDQMLRDGDVRLGPYFLPGDYVMVTDVRNSRSKLVARKLGPAVVEEAVSDWVYKVRSILDGHVREVHAERLEMYEDQNFKITAQLQEQLKHQLISYEVERLVRARLVDGHWQVLVKWRGF